MYSEEVRNRALQLLDEGRSSAEVSQLMGGSPKAAIIRRWANGYVPKGKRAQQKLFTQEEKLAALERLDAGESYRDLAAELGCAPSTLLTWRRIRHESGDDALITKIDRR